MNNKYHVIVDRFLMLMHTNPDVTFVKGANEKNKQKVMFDEQVWTNKAKD